jgi:sugar phosphate isomerase/epimerase
MRLGGPLFAATADPADWVADLRSKGYRAAFCPVDHTAPASLVADFRRAAEEACLVIAEVGAWSNPLSPDESERKKAILYCQQQLDLAEQIGARCCVNIAGSRGRRWDGPDPANLTPDTMALIVDSVREIIDAVRPAHTFYTLETMPWMYPDSADAYLALIRSIGRRQFAVHLDPVNLVCSPVLYFQNAALLRECFEKLGRYIRSCHAKDIHLADDLTVHLSEVIPGRGRLDYRVFLQELNRLDADTPLMIEHLGSASEYEEAAGYIRRTASATGLAI